MGWRERGEQVEKWFSDRFSTCDPPGRRVRQREPRRGAALLAPRLARRPASPLSHALSRPHPASAGLRERNGSLSSERPFALAAPTPLGTPSEGKTPKQRCFLASLCQLHPRALSLSRTPRRAPAGGAAGLSLFSSLLFTFHVGQLRRRQPPVKRILGQHDDALVVQALADFLADGGFPGGGAA